MSGVVTASVADGVGVIELREKFNCLSMAVISGIDEALTRLVNE